MCFVELLVRNKAVLSSIFLEGTNDTGETSEVRSSGPISTRVVGQLPAQRPRQLVSVDSEGQGPVTDCLERSSVLR